MNHHSSVPPVDQVLVDIAEYVTGYDIDRAEAYSTARYCLMDSLACAFQALDFAACTKLLGPVVPGAVLPRGCRVPGTKWELDPVQAAFNIGTMIRWLDFNDTWLAAEWGHPSDNLGGILAACDYRQRRGVLDNDSPMIMRDVLTAMIKAHEIQGVLALENSFNRVGLDHVLLVRVATTAVVTRLLGGDREAVIRALSHAWVDGGALRTYRHAPNTGSRKSWAAGDAASRGVRLALLSLTGEMGYRSVLSAEKWGFCDVLLDGNPLQFSRGYGSYVMENVLFKIAYPAEFHAQTAVEAAMTLHEAVCDRLEEVVRIVIETQEPAVRIIDKSGPLHNPADRDHCLRYMTVVPLIFGRLVANDYEDDVAADPRIDRLRSITEVRENPDFTTDYYDAEKRFISNAVQVYFVDGTCTDRVQVDCPIGHRRRRHEGIPRLVQKFESSLRPRLASWQWQRLAEACNTQDKLENTTVDDFLSWLTVA